MSCYCIILEFILIHILIVVFAIVSIIIFVIIAIIIIIMTIMSTLLLILLQIPCESCSFPPDLLLPEIAVGRPGGEVPFVPGVDAAATGFHCGNASI